MSKETGVVIVSRVLAIYFMVLAFYRFTDIPVEVMAYLHYKNYTEMGIGSYFYRVEVEALSHSVLIIAVDLFAALIFLRCGPSVERFLLGGRQDSTRESTV
jgi:hypothetical protein